VFTTILFSRTPARRASAPLVEPRTLASGSDVRIEDIDLRTPWPTHRIRWYLSVDAPVTDKPSVAPSHP
jgi:hypothetical protein